jgi:hypothetical protein
VIEATVKIHRVQLQEWHAHMRYFVLLFVLGLAACLPGSCAQTMTLRAGIGLYLWSLSKLKLDLPLDPCTVVQIGSCFLHHRIVMIEVP